jgi:hypothetical protein
VIVAERSAVTEFDAVLFRPLSQVNNPADLGSIRVRAVKRVVTWINVHQRRIAIPRPRPLQCKSAAARRESTEARRAGEASGKQTGANCSAKARTRKRAVVQKSF